MIAHINKSGLEESVYDHCKKTAEISSIIASESGLKKTSYLSAILHDMGKNTIDFEEYIRCVSQKNGRWKKNKINHSSAGGKYIYEQVNKKSGKPIDTITSFVIAWSIFSHHGLNDIITVDGKNKFAERYSPNTEIHYKEVVELWEHESEEDFEQMFELAKEEIRILSSKLKISKKRHFDMGMLMRMNLSILIDSDRIATSRFMEEREHIPFQQKRNLQLWHGLQDKLNEYIKKFPNDNWIANIRKTISDNCFQAGKRKSGIYTLQVPTGGGKTLASMRFALEHAIQNKKQRIFYISPYKSILEQSSSVYRDVFQKDEIILEHHSDIVIENEAEDYTAHVQSWDKPIVLTTLVQFLTTLYSSKTQAIRRMHSLLNSIIIVDEIQSLPTFCVTLFNVAMNYFATYHNTTIILCSATQPPLGEAEHSLQLQGEIVEDAPQLYEKLKRVRIVNNIAEVKTCEQIVQLAIKKLEISNSGLIIVNTKQVAKAIAQELINLELTNTRIIHLSTNMCAEHRNEKIAEYKKILKEIKEKKKNDKQKVICISTQLIEAGVDISADWVIRSLAGWDSIIQAAGRCNRNGEVEFGIVEVVSCAEEKLDNLIDIKIGQDCSRRVLSEFKRNPELYEDDLASLKVIEQYYQYYFYEKKQGFDYNIKKYDTTIYDMLSENSIGYGRWENNEKGKQNLNRIYFRQAFKQAGDEFEVINHATIGVIVPYKEGKNIINSLNSELDTEQINLILRKAQPYTVNTYESALRKLEEEGAIAKLYSCDGYYIVDGYYDEVYGITKCGILIDLIL